MTILNYSDIDLKKISYNVPEKQGLIYYSSINYDNEPLFIQTPRMSSKNSGEEVLKNKKTNTLDLETINIDYSFHDFLLNFDEHNIKVTYNGFWFITTIYTSRC